MIGVELARLVGIDLLPPEACEALPWRPGGPHSHMGGGREGRRREEEKEKEEKEEKEEENETTDSTSMLESSRNPTVPCTSEVATEPTNENPGSQGSSVPCDLVQDRPQLQCSGCNNTLTESYLSEMDNVHQSLKQAGWDTEWVEQHPACAACINYWIS